MNDKNNNCLGDWNTDAVYLGLDDDITFPSPGRIFDLIKLDSQLDHDFSEYCSSREISKTDLNSVCDWVGAGIGTWKYAEEWDRNPLQVSLKQAVAEILSTVIRFKEGFGILEAGFGSEGRASLEALPIYPWDMDEREKSLTREEVISVIEKYMKTVSDDKIDFNRYLSRRSHGGEYVKSVEGDGICLEDMRISGPEHIVDLIRQAPETYQSFMQYCNRHDVHTVTMRDFTGWIGCEQVNYAIAEILCRVIEERENVRFLPASVRDVYSGEICTSIVFEEKNPWEYNDAEKKLTSKDFRGILKNYTAFISDDVPQIWRIDF